MKKVIKTPFSSTAALFSRKLKMIDNDSAGKTAGDENEFVIDLFD